MLGGAAERTAEAAAAGQWLEAVLPYAGALGKLVLAGACGASVGWEREAHEKSAGLRTHILMAVGACLFALVARDLIRAYPDADIVRVIQGALIGTGFVCSGVIFRDQDNVRGLTTAAGLWIMGAVGVAVGFGSFFLAIVTTVLTVIAMTLLRRGKKRIRPRAVDERMGGREGKTGEPERPAPEDGESQRD